MPGKHYDLDTDVTLSGNDDKVIASQKATKTYVDTEVDKKADPTIIRDTNSDISVKELVINRLTNEEYDVAVKEDDQLYLTPDTTDQDIADAVSAHNTSNSAHSTLFNAKQDKLATQTAYTSKGTASKVPQITTNTLGQVTNITEVDITHQSIKTLKTDNTTGQTASSSEAIAGSGTINLHKVSKTGSYNDLLNKPAINDGTLKIQVEGIDKNTFTANQSTNTTINITKDDFFQTKTYTGIIASENNQANATFYFMTVRGTTWNSEWAVRYRIDATLDEGLTPSNYQYFNSSHECYITGRQGVYTVYANFNSHSSTSYRPIYYIINHKTTEAGYNAGYGTKLGVDLTSSNSNLDTNYKRTIKITIYDCKNCTVTLNENPEIPPNSTRTNYDKLPSTYYTTSDANNAGNWTRLNGQDNGLQESGDANTTYGYLVNTINTGATKIDANGYGARYSLIFATTPLNTIDERWSSLVNSSGNGTAKTALTALTFYIDRHPQYVYSANIAAGAASANALYQDFNATDVRYTCNTNNTYVTALKKCFLYLKDFNQSNMSFKSDATIGNVFTLDKIETRFPSSTTGDVYIYFLGWTTGTWYNLVPAFTQVHKIFKYTPSTGAMEEFTRDRFNQKQDKLDTQTAYSSKGSATKVPQITTNSLGQVTNISEVTITQPTVNNKTITIQKNSTTVDSFTLNQSTDKTINISVPTTVAELSDSSNYVQTSSLEEAATVAKTGDYNDLINKPTIPQGTVTSVRVQATSPVVSSQNTAQTGTLNTTISLADAYGDTKNPYGSKTANTVLAAPNGSNGAPSFRALTKTDIPLASETAVSGGTTTSLVTTGEKYTWNSKQDALSTQTAYTSKGSATKVPQITTNSLGQVTGITEVTISQPTVNNKTITIQKNGTTVDSFTLNQSTDKTINISGIPVDSDLVHKTGNESIAGIKTFTDYTIESGTDYRFKQLSPTYRYKADESPTTTYYWWIVGDYTQWGNSSGQLVYEIQRTHEPRRPHIELYTLKISRYSTSVQCVSLMNRGECEPGTGELKVAMLTDGKIVIQSYSTWTAEGLLIRQIDNDHKNVDFLKNPTHIGYSRWGQLPEGYEAIKIITDTGFCGYHLTNGFEYNQDYCNIKARAQSAINDIDGNAIKSTYLKLSGGTLTGAVNTANNTLNKIGDDAYIGDVNIAGCVGIKGQNGASGIVFKPYSGSTDIKMTSNGSGTLTVTGTISSTFSGDLTGTASKATADADGNTISTTYLKTANLPTKLSDFTDDLGSSPTHTHSQYLTDHQTIKTLKTTNTVAQSTSASEAITGSGTINLHKIAKTGTFSDLVSKPTSLSGYGITDAYTKTEVDGMISSVYKPAGSVAFASLPTLSDNVLGNVYNVTDAFTTTANFVEGAGKSYPAGTNVVVVNTGTTASPTYKFDVLAGFVDLSGYVPTSRKVNGKALSADITISKSDVGLGNVDNTSDSDKPISTATQTALDGKENTISDLSKIRSGANSFYVKGTQTASTNAFTGVLNAVSELYEGLTIDYWLPFAGTSTAATLNLTLAGGTTTGAVNCYYSGTTRLTTHLSANCVGRLIYQTVTISGTSYTGWWLLKAYYTEGSNTYDREYDNYYRGYAGMALPKYGLLMKGANGRLYSLTATYETAATKVVTTVGLRPDLIWWNNSNATTNAGAVIKAQALYRSMPSTAGSSVFNASVPTYCDIYLCGNYDENTGLFYLATTDANGNASVTDYYRFVPYNTEPIYSNYFITGRYYIFVGSSYSTANYYHLMNQHPMYYFDGTNLINAADKPKYAATFVDWSE